MKNVYAPATAPNWILPVPNITISSTPRIIPHQRKYIENLINLDFMLLFLLTIFEMLYA